MRIVQASVMWIVYAQIRIYIRVYKTYSSENLILKYVIQSMAIKQSTTWEAMCLLF